MTNKFNKHGLKTESWRTSQSISAKPDSLPCTTNLCALLVKQSWIWAKWLILKSIIALSPLISILESIKSNASAKITKCSANSLILSNAWSLEILLLKCQMPKNYSWHTHEKMKVRDLEAWVEILPTGETGREKTRIFLFLSTENQIKLNEMTENHLRHSLWELITTLNITQCKVKFFPFR